MKKNPSFTVIMPTYNGRKYLKRAIESVLSQDLKDFELIIARDGGEGIDDILNKFKDDRIICMNLEHHGKAHTLNVALRAANGKYIAYMDDDDIIFPNHLETLNKGLKENEFVYTAVNDSFVDEGNNLQVIQKTVFGKQTSFLELIKYSYIGQISIGHTKKLIERAGYYNEELKRYIDWNMIVRLARLSEPTFINEVTAERYWYFRDGKMTNRISGRAARNPKGEVRDRLELFNKSIQLLTPHEIQTLLVDLLEKKY